MVWVCIQQKTSIPALLESYSSVAHLKTSMRPSSEAQAREFEPWQKTNAFIFQPTKHGTETFWYHLLSFKEPQKRNHLQANYNVILSTHKKVTERLVK